MLTLTLLPGVLLICFLFVGGFLAGLVYQQSRHNKNSQHEEMLALHEKLGELQALLYSEKELTKQKTELLDNAKKQLRDELALLSSTVLEEKTHKFTKNNSEQLGLLLTPLREQLGEFDKKLRESHYQQTQERLSLITEIKHLKDLNQKINQEAINLTHALRGGNKIQGCWGEVILARILEKSGLEQGREYEIQVQSTNEEGKVFRPDVIVRLPEDRHIVIDAKVSLVSYLRYQEAEDDTSRELALSQHIISIRQHIKDLSSKEYHKLSGLTSLDFVLLFSPIEAALSIALQKDPELFTDALESNVVLVSPTTLLTTLRTVNTLWRIEQQNKNALEIATRAGDLYDKLASFVVDLQDVGKKLDSAQRAYDTASAKLSTGRGNLLSRAQYLRKLGAKTNKSFTLTYEEEAEDL